jgi:hypothetical protein
VRRKSGDSIVVRLLMPKTSMTATRAMPGIRFIALFIAAAACYNASSAPITEIVGTWGGDNAGLIAGDTSAHVHIGCTLGDTKSSIRPDADGRFDVIGTYNVDAYPIDRGITHPARFTGHVAGHTMTLTVILTDTARQVGPVTLIYGKEPKMGPCPICRTPKQRSAANARH